jgi:hypothetical protein
MVLWWRWWLLLHAEHLGIAMAIGRSGDGTTRGRLPGPTTVLVPFVEMDELLMADKEIADVHISIFLQSQLRSVDTSVNYEASKQGVGCARALEGGIWAG